MARNRRFALIGITALTTVSVGANMPSPASAKSQAKELIKYLNPAAEKGYTNESQDRLIKKSAFKSSQMPELAACANKDIGFFVTVPHDKLNDAAALQEMVNKPLVNGLSVMFTWNELEPADSQFNFSQLDQALDICSRSQKSLIVRVSTCGMDTNPASSDTPKWVFDAGAKSISYEGADGQGHLMPIFWDTTYLANWSNFVKELGKRYDNNPFIHSFGITGGGALGSTMVLPVATENSHTQSAEIETQLKKDFGMDQRQLGEHWKYVVDIFAKAFPTARLNFDIDPATPGRAGQDTLDQITDYLVYRYGDRIFLCRQNVNSAKHGFDEFRIFLKFRSDTESGLQLTGNLDATTLDKISKFALDDGVSFIELPETVISSTDATAQKTLSYLADHLGYELVVQGASIQDKVQAGEPIKASFTFMNLGDAAPIKPNREFDKDVAGSYKVAVELRDKEGKTVVVSLHTPAPPTNKWQSGKAITWDEDLKMPKLEPGEYSAWLSLVDVDANRRIRFIYASSSEPKPIIVAPLGTVKVLPESSSIGATPSEATH